MDALIFDFDGVIFDSEPAHIAGFEKIVKPFGIEFTHQQYCAQYLGFDDYEVLQLMGEHFNQNFSQQQINQLVAEKTAFLQKNLAEITKPIAGVVDLIVAAAKADIPLAVCSGGLRDEIELGLKRLNVRDLFPVILAAEDVACSKPDPEGYIAAAKLLAEHTGQAIKRQRCVAIEDSPTGLDAAQGAGMKALAVTSTFNPGTLAWADMIVEDLRDVTIEMLDKKLLSPEG